MYEIQEILWVPKLKMMLSNTAQPKPVDALNGAERCKRGENCRHYFKSRRKCYLFFASYTLLAIILIELVLINPSLRPVEAGKKKKIIKKLKEVLPLIALLKRKKIVLLPIPL